MKTLYININNEQIQSNDELVVLPNDLYSDFFFYLGEKVAKGCKVENENALITDFNTQDNAEDYQKIIALWNEIKTILFSEECEGVFEFVLPDGYIHWLRYSEKYNHVHDKNFSHGESHVISIDLEELHKESVEDLQRKILRKLQRDDLYFEIDEILFNDNAVTRKSPIIRAIKEKYEGIGFKAYKKWLQGKCETDTRNNNQTITRHETTTNAEEIFIVASDRMENDETKWFSEFYTKDGKALTGTYGYINNGRSPFYFFDGNYYCIKKCKLKKITLSECTGATIIDEENSFYEYLILRNNFGTFVINNDGEILIPNGVYDEIKCAYNDCVLALKDGLWGVVSLKAEVLIDFQYNRISALKFYDLRYYSIENENGEVGVIDKYGNIVINPKFEDIGILGGYDGSVWFTVSQDFISYGIIDEYENVVIPMEYDDIDILIDAYDYLRETSLPSFFEIKKGNESGVINSDGEFVIPLDSYDDIIIKEDCIFADYEDDYDFLKNEWIHPPFIYEIPNESCLYDQNGLRVYQDRPCVIFKENKTHYLKDKKGRIVYSSYCSDLYNNSYPHEELWGNSVGYDECCYIEELISDDYTKSRYKYKIIGSNGKVLGEIREGLKPMYFVNGIALCRDLVKDEFYCFINTNGRIIKRCPQKEKYLIKEGKYYFVEDCGNIGYYDTSLSKTIMCNNKNVKDLQDTMQEGIFSVKTKRGNWGLLNYYTGKLLEYEGLERIDPLCNEDADYFKLHKNGKITLIDKDGNCIIKKEYIQMTCIQPNK